MAFRLIPSLIVGGLAGALSIELGAAPVAAIPATLLGALSIWLLSTDLTAPPAPPPEQPEPFETARPLLQRFLDAVEDPLLLVERQQVMLANEAALRIFGQHIVGEDVRIAIRHPAATDRLTAPTASEGRSIHLAGLGGTDRHWDMSVHDVGDDRRLVHLIDRTSSYAAERMRVDFVANASHELRTPLATLIGFLETLEKGSAAADPETRERFLKIMAGEARRMQRLVDDLISLSRVEGEKFSPPDTALRLVPLVSEVVSAAEASTPPDERRVKIEATDKAVEVKGDHVQLSQLLHNLIGNALKYGRPGTPVTVTVAPADEAMVRLAISDQGEGIAPQHLPRLTERFYRVDAGRSRSMGGTGLGLAIVKHIVERHGGRLTIDSKLGIGTTVTVLLPTA